MSQATVLEEEARAARRDKPCILPSTLNVWLGPACGVYSVCRRAAWQASPRQGRRVSPVESRASLMARHIVKMADIGWSTA